MTLSSAYIELFIRGKSGGKCQWGNFRIRRRERQTGSLETLERWRDKEERMKGRGSKNERKKDAGREIEKKSVTEIYALYMG